MKKTQFVFGALALVLMACGKDDDGGGDNLNTTDRDFVMMASISNNAEVSAGQLAASKGTNALVKTYGQQMVMEHTMAQADLKSRASSVGLSAADTVDAEHRALMVRLNSLSGYSFDTAYMNSQVRDHAKTLTLFDTELSNGRHQQIRGYAEKYRPSIQLHFNRADSIRKVL